jgi:hypothetical protein
MQQLCFFFIIQLSMYLVLDAMGREPHGRRERIGQQGAPMRPTLALMPAIFLTAVVAFAVPSFAQNSDFNLDVHANSHATAKDIGLPVYPGATPFKEKDSDSSSADLGFLLNSFHFSVKAASFVAMDSPDHVLEFYRKPLAKFGQVLECDHGKPVGSLTVAKSGLTCGDSKSGHMTVNGSDSDHELRAGTPEQFRIVGIAGFENGKTKFGLVALVLPKDEHGK